MSIGQAAPEESTESIEDTQEEIHECYICPQCECSSMEKTDEHDDKGNVLYRYTCRGCGYSERK